VKGIRFPEVWVEHKVDQDFRHKRVFELGGELMIAIEGLTNSYDTVPALRGIAVPGKRGEMLGFLGPNRAGRTTTMRTRTCGIPISG
jgi:ABC-type polysaccharide/polyol phosphate transport system ATPase subunit